MLERPSTDKKLYITSVKSFKRLGQESSYQTRSKWNFYSSQFLTFFLFEFHLKISHNWTFQNWLLIFNFKLFSFPEWKLFFPFFLKWKHRRKKEASCMHINNWGCKKIFFSKWRHEKKTKTAITILMMFTVTPWHSSERHLAENNFCYLAFGPELKLTLIILPLSTLTLPLKTHLSLSLTHTQTHTVSLSHTQSLSLTHKSLSLSLTHSLSLSHTHTHTQSLYLSHTQSLSLHTHTHTHMFVCVCLCVSVCVCVCALIVRWTCERQYLCAW
jgi:hypothetical protein